MFTHCYFFVPGISDKYQSGGLRVALQTRSFFSAIHPHATCEVVTTHEKVNGAMYAQDFFEAQKLLPREKGEEEETLCVVTWGPLVADHIALIRKHLPRAKILFYAQSFGWGIKVPAHIPIICVSRFVMSQWALYSKGNFVGYVPPSLSEVFEKEPDTSLDRDIDLLVHTRKQNAYCLEKLLPTLKQRGIKTHTIDTWIDQNEFAELLKRTKVFLYCTALHKAGFFRRLPGEGFGLPALEAVASGCQVASNLLGGVTDFLTPGVNCIKIESGSLTNDVTAIEQAIKNFKPTYDKKLIHEYSAPTIKDLWRGTLSTIYYEG